MAADPHGHQPCGHLVVGYFTARVAGNEEVDFFAESSPDHVFADQVDSAHAFEKRTASVTLASGAVNAQPLPCRRKMRMSGLCKVEMSAFHGWAEGPWKRSEWP